MSSTAGAQLAALLFEVIDEMVAEVVAELDRRGHPRVTPTLEFALVAINEGAETASALGRSLKVSKQAAAKTISTLEQLGYVCREPDAADARRRRLVVSPRGEAMMSMGAEVFDVIRNRWASRIGESRVVECESALRQLLK